MVETAVLQRGTSQDLTMITKIFPGPLKFPELLLSFAVCRVNVEIDVHASMTLDLLVCFCAYVCVYVCSIRLGG